MVKITYVKKGVTKDDMEIIMHAIPILKELYATGYRVTLRQLYYQFVTRNLFPNSDKMYKKLCRSIRRGRMAGLIDWDAIEDRTRSLRFRSRWADPADILYTCANLFHTDYWQNQVYRVELWIEKDAVLGVVERTCREWDCPYFSCRGYSSISELHEASQRIKEYNNNGQRCKILYCGDHDPSGLNMCDSIKQNLTTFGAVFKFESIALNMEQIDFFNLPPNPVKKSDTRSDAYCELYGDECWELDALSPQTLNDIIELEIVKCIDNMNDFDARRAEDVAGRKQLGLVGKYFNNAHHYVKNYLVNDEEAEDE